MGGGPGLGRRGAGGVRCKKSKEGWNEGVWEEGGGEGGGEGGWVRGRYGGSGKNGK